MTILDFDKLFEKQPSEQKTLRLELAAVVSGFVITGYELTSAEIKVFDFLGTEVSTDMIDGSVTLDSINNYVYVTIKNGIDGLDYCLKLKTTWIKAGQPDQIDEKDLVIRVRQKGY